MTLWDWKQGVSTLFVPCCRRHVCTPAFVAAARRVKQPSLRVTGVSLTSTEYSPSPHDISAQMVDWDVSWDAVVGKACEDWTVVISAGSLQVSWNYFRMFGIGCNESRLCMRNAFTFAVALTDRDDPKGKEDPPRSRDSKRPEASGLPDAQEHNILRLLDRGPGDNFGHQPRSPKRHRLLHPDVHEDCRRRAHLSP